MKGIKHEATYPFRTDTQELYLQDCILHVMYDRRRSAYLASTHFTTSRHVRRVIHSHLRVRALRNVSQCEPHALDGVVRGGNDL